MSIPTVSVVIPVRDGERYLGAAIDSALMQQAQPAEVIVVDDGSTDTSRQIALGYGPPVCCIAHAQRGIGGARNVGIAASTGEFVSFLDADDLWTEGSLSSRLAAVATDRSVEVVFGHVRQFLSPDVDESLAAQLTPPADLYPGYLGSAAMIRSSALERVGGFREDIVSGEFIDWMARARELDLREVVVDELVLWRRIHASNHGRIRADARVDYARVLKSALDRRRAARPDAPS